MRKKRSFLRTVIIKTAKTLSGLFIENHLLQVSDDSITSEKIPAAFENYRIVQLSDLHSASFGRGNIRLIQKIDAIKPDLIVMTGDMVSRSDFHHKVFFNLADTLGKKYPCCYIIGNHEQDMERGERKAFLARLEAMNIHVLDNDRVSICKENQKINLYGMWFSLKYYKEANKQSRRTPEFSDRDMRRTMGIYDVGSYGILLTHNPLSFPVYARWGADLTLCGHVHGGMIRLPFAGGLLSPEREFFPKYSAGIYGQGDKKLLVSRGLGSGLFGARILNRPEIVVITLHHQG